MIRAAAAGVAMSRQPVVVLGNDGSQQQKALFGWWHHATQALRVQPNVNALHAYYIIIFNSRSNIIA